MNKIKVKKNGRFILSVCLIAGMITGMFGEMVAYAETQYYYDEAKVYDMSELSKGKKEEIISGNYANSLGELPTTENVAVSFNMTKPTSLNWNVKHCFLNTTGMSYNNAGGYYIYYHYQGSNEIRIESLDGTGSYSKVAYDWNQGTSKQVEVGSVNVYSDAEKQSQVAKKVYVKIDGTVVLEHMDTTFANATYGKYVSVPVVDGNFGTNSGRVRTNYSFDTAMVYDMQELSNKITEETIGNTAADYAKSLGALPSAENVAISFTMTKPTGLNWNVKQTFFNTTGKNNNDGGGYRVFYHYQGKAKIRIEKDGYAGTAYSEAAYDFAQGATKKVEVGTVNVYADAEKQTQVGREVYVKLDGTVVLSYLDTDFTNGIMGKYVSVPVVDGTIAANSGSIHTGYFFDTATVYNMSQLSEYKTEDVIDGTYEKSLGKLPSAENVAMSFIMTKPTGINWNVKQSFMNTTGTNHVADGGYYIYYHYQGADQIRIEARDKEGEIRGYRSVNYNFAQGTTQKVEVGAVNVYADYQKQTKIGQQVYVKIDETVVLEYVDTNLENGNIGQYVSAPVVDGTFTENSGRITTTYDNAYDVSIYRSNAPYTYPSKETYVFAGWYTDKDFTIPLATDVKTGIAFAKFVKKSVLSVKGQLSTGVSADDKTTNLRVLTSVDTLDYESVAFTVKFGDVRTFTNKSMTVYKTVTAIEGSMEAISYDAKTAFKNTVSEYFMAYTIKGIPNEVFGTAVTVTPSWTTLDGTVVTGEIKEFTINQAIEELQDDTYIKYVDSAQKVLQKTEYTGSEYAALAVSMAKAETESVQIVIAPNQEVSSVEVVTYDLYDGNLKLSKENIGIYWEKYLVITKKYNDNSNYPEGSYVPDALLPMKTAVSYKENKIAANENQGIWLDITTTSDTIPGNYSGQVDVIVDGKTYTHELYVEVVDIDLSAVEGEVNFWSLHMRDSFATNEMDSSDEITAAYFEKLLKYNVQTDLPFSGEGGAEAFAQMVKKYYDYPGFSTYRFYYERSTHWEAGNTYWYVDSEVLEQYVRALATLSMEEHRDYFNKAFFVLSNIIDEPYSELAYKKVEFAYGRLHTTLAEISEKLLSEFAGHENYSFYKETVKNSIANIPLTLAESMPEVADILENEYGLDYISHNVSLGFYDTQEKRDEYSSYVESVDNGDTFNTGKWWYTCVSPTYPYPSNHLDDDVLGLKTLFWMQNFYEVDGHFNWAVSYHSDGKNNGIGRDPYTDGDYMNSLPMGDGYMTYPGYPYGIEGPVMSIRLAVMRDGVDDAKYMQMIRSLYAEQGDDVSEYLASICKPIFTGTKTTNDVDAYNKARTEMINTVLELKDKWGEVYRTVETTKDDTLIETESRPNQKENEQEANNEEKILTDSDAYETYMIADFESYEAIRQMKSRNSLGTLTENRDATFIKSGFQSLKLQVHGRENLGYSTNREPMLEIYTSVESVGKVDYSNYNEFRICMYNAMNYDVMMQFMVNDNYANRRVIWLTPGWNDVVIDIDTVLYKELLGINQINKFQFIFDRGELHEEKEVVYFDAFRAVRTKEISSKLTYQITNGIINNFEQQHDLNYILNGCYGYSGEYYIGNGLTKSVFSDSGSALRIYANPVETIRTNIVDEWRVALMQPELLVQLQTGLNAIRFYKYRSQNVCFDLYNNGEEAVTIYVYYYQESKQVQGTKETFVVQPKETLNFKQAFSTILEAEDGNGNKWSDTTKWTGLMIGFDIPHTSNGDAPVDLIVDNYRFEEK